MTKRQRLFEAKAIVAQAVRQLEQAQMLLGKAELMAVRDLMHAIHLASEAKYLLEAEADKKR